MDGDLFFRVTFISSRIHRDDFRTTRTAMNLGDFRFSRDVFDISKSGRPNLDELNGAVPTLYDQRHIYSKASDLPVRNQESVFS